MRPRTRPRSSPAALLAGPPVAPAPADAAERAPAAHRATAKQPTAVGAAAPWRTVDPEATRAGLAVLRHGGNAVDAAVAAAATLGVTEPYSSGIGGGGYFVYYDAKTRKVRTIDGRETAPQAMTPTRSWTNGVPIDFNEAVTSGLSVGVPGTPATWQRALRPVGHALASAQALKPADRVARHGFVVDQTFRAPDRGQPGALPRLHVDPQAVPARRQPPAVGSVFRNPQLADTYDALGRKGIDWLYDGALGREIVHTVQAPAGPPRRDPQRARRA